MHVYLGKQIVFPFEITQTTLRPDVMWSATAKIIELTFSWEEGIPAAQKIKWLRYTELAADCQEAGWTTIIHPVEVG